MIRFEMELVPMGTQLYGTDSLVYCGIVSSDDNSVHHYRLTVGDHVITGEVPKDKSGHRNPLHLLLNIMKDAEPQILALGLNYVKTRWDK